MRPAILISAALFALPAAAEVPEVMTDIPAVQSLAAMVMGDIATPDVLLDPSASAHSYQMRPSEARAVQRADLVIWVGPELTPWLDRAIAGAQGTSLALLETDGTHLREFDAEGGEEAHDDAHGHAHEGTDPHAWLDPANAEVWLSAIAEELGSLDPENAAAYSANADTARGTIRAMDARIGERLAPVTGRPFIVYHEAYGYFAEHYGLTLSGAIAEGDAAQPGAAHLAEIRDLLEAGEVVCAFPEAQHDPKPVEVLVEGTNVRVGAPLDPTGSRLHDGPGLYVALMENLAETLVECLSGE